MVLDLRPFDTVEGVGFNELFIFVANPFPNPNSFGNPDYIRESWNFVNFCFRQNPIFWVLAHLGWRDTQRGSLFDQWLFLRWNVALAPSCLVTNSLNYHSVGCGRNGVGNFLANPFDSSQGFRSFFLARFNAGTGWRKKPSRCSSAFVPRPWLTSTPLSFSRRRLRNERASRARKNHPTVPASIIPRFLAQRGGKQRTREHWRTASAVLRNCFLSSFAGEKIFGSEEPRTFARVEGRNEFRKGEDRTVGGWKFSKNIGRNAGGCNGVIPNTWSGLGWILRVVGWVSLYCRPQYLRRRSINTVNYIVPVCVSSVSGILK